MIKLTVTVTQFFNVASLISVDEATPLKASDKYSVSSVALFYCVRLLNACLQKVDIYCNWRLPVQDVRCS